MTDSEQVNSIRKDLRARVESIDLDHAWQLSGGSSVRPEAFVEGLCWALDGYHNSQGRPEKMSAQDFRRKIVKLQRSSEILKTEIAEVHPFLKYHIEDSFLFNEPENSFDLQVGEFEGLSYGEFRLDQLTERLDEFLVILEDANEHFNPPRHRPKELEHLENSIKRLGIVFEKISGDEPLSTYTMAEVGRGGKEYSGPFFDFACHVLWGFAGKEFPQRSALAETARRVFGKK